MKLTKGLIKKLVMESLEESPVGGGSQVVSSATMTNPMDDDGENGTFEELSDGTFRLKGKDGNVVDLSPEEMEKLVARYEESRGYEGGHETEEPETPVQETGMSHLQEGRLTKSSLQAIIKEEYSKLLEGLARHGTTKRSPASVTANKKALEDLKNRIAAGETSPPGGWSPAKASRSGVKEATGEYSDEPTAKEIAKYFTLDKQGFANPKGGLPPNLSGPFELTINGRKQIGKYRAHEVAEKYLKNPQAHIEIIQAEGDKIIRPTDWKMRSGNNR